LLYFSFLLYGIKYNFNLLLASFFITFVVYSFDKISCIDEDYKRMQNRSIFIYNNKNLILFGIFISYISAFIFTLITNLYALIIIHFPLLIGMIYSRKIFNVRLKNIIGIKNIVVALSWTIIGTFLPLVINSKEIIIIFFVFYYIFIKLLINTIIFDIRDIKGDSMNGVITIPVFLGLKKSKNLLLILNSTLILWLIFSNNLFYKYFYILIFTIIYGYLYILYFCKNNKMIGKSLDIFVDGEFIIIFIITQISIIYTNLYIP